MTPGETEAYAAAKEIVLRAQREWWPYVNLSPYVHDQSQLRQEFAVLSALTALPPEIEVLERCKVLDLRGTKISDLSSIAQLPQLERIEFSGIPACDEYPELGEIAGIDDARVRVKNLQRWLEQNAPAKPPEVIPEGPIFLVPDEPPIMLSDAGMGDSEDFDQAQLLDEARTKADALYQIAELANNVAPRLPKAIERYNKLIHQDADQIGARIIWSNANTLKSIWEVHQSALRDDRTGEELPPSVASYLDDLLQTHSVWFLGHPGAREVQARASSHQRGDNVEARRNAAVAVVEAADQSGVVSTQAIAPAKANLETSMDSTPSGVAAVGELEDWAFNFIASIARKLWVVAKEPPGGVLSSSVCGAYLVQFVFTYEAALGSYSLEFMANGPVWWDAMLATVRRSHLSTAKDRQT